MAFAPAIGSYPYWCVVLFLCERVQTPNAITKRKHQTLPANATSNGGDAGRVAPIRGSVWGFYQTTTTYTPSILHLTQIRCNSLTINVLLSVRYYKFYLHATYTPYTPYILPHGTNTRGRYHRIGEQKRLLLRQIVLRPCGVKPAAYVQTDCATAGWCV